MANVLATRPLAPSSSDVVPPVSALIHGTAVTALALFWGFALVLVVRRIAGGLVDPLQPAAALPLSLALCTAALVIRTATLLSSPLGVTNPRGRSFWLLLVLPGAASLVVALASTLPRTTAAAATALYLPLALFEAGSLVVVFWLARNSLQWARPSWLSSQAILSRPQHPPGHAARHEQPFDPNLLPPGVTQRLTRSRTAAGLDLIRGTLKVQFAAHQRTEIVHVAFCPPFDATPTWSAQAIAGPALSIKQAQVYPHGARVEVRLGEIPAAGTEAVITFSAVEQRS